MQRRRLLPGVTEWAIGPKSEKLDLAKLEWQMPQGKFLMQVLENATIMQIKVVSVITIGFGLILKVCYVLCWIREN